MIVVIETVLAKVGDIDIGPAVIVIIGDGNTNSPPVIGDACFWGSVGKRAVVIVVKERSFRRSRFSAQSINSRSIGEIDIEPAIVVVVDQADTGAVCLNDVMLLRRSHGVLPCSQARLLGDVLKDGGPAFDEAASGDWPVFAVEHCC